MGNKGRQEVRAGEVGVELAQSVGERFEVLCGESDVAALQGSAAGEVGRTQIAVSGELASAERLLRVVDAGDEVTKVDVGVFRRMILTSRRGSVTTLPV